MTRIILVLLVLLVSASSALAATLATEDYESGTYCSGTGWTDSCWTNTGSVTIFGYSNPYEGNRHMLLRGSGGVSERSLNTSTTDSITITFASRQLGFQSGHNARLVVNGNTVQEWTDANTHADWHLYEFNVTGTPDTTTIRYEANMANLGQEIHFDAIQVTSLETDTTPPAVSFDPASASTATPYNVTVTVVDADIGVNVSSIEYCLSSSGNCTPNTPSASSEFNVSITIDGNYTLCVYASDDLQNNDTTCSAEGAYLLDKTPPSISFDPTSASDNDAYNVSVNVTDSLVGLDESSVSYCLIDGAASCIPDTSGTSLFNVTINTDGDYTICVYAADDLNNNDTVCSAEGAYALAYPSLGQVSAVANSGSLEQGYANGQVEWYSFFSNFTNITCERTVDGGGNWTITPVTLIDGFVNYVVPSLGTDTYNVSFRCKEDDRAFVTTNFVSVMGDPNNPTIVFDPTSASSSVSYNVSVNITDSGIGVDGQTVEYCVSSSGNCTPDTLSGSSSFNTTIPSLSGSYTVCVYASDLVGNSHTVCSDEGAYTIITIADADPPAGERIAADTAIYIWPANSGTDVSIGGYSNWTRFSHSGPIAVGGLFIPELHQFLVVRRDFTLNKGYLYSTYNGIDWNLSSFDTEIFSAGYSPKLDLYVLVGRDGIVYTSSDLTNWSNYTLGTVTLATIRWFEEEEVFISTTMVGNTVYRSADGENWNSSSSGLSVPITRLEYVDGAGLLHAKSQTRHITFSDDGSTWTHIYVGTAAGTMEAMYYDDSVKYIGVGQHARIRYSNDTVTWTQSGTDGTGTMVGIYKDPYLDTLIKISDGGVIRNSTDGIVWDAYATRTVNALKVPLYNWAYAAGVGDISVVSTGGEYNDYYRGTLTFNARLFGFENATCERTLNGGSSWSSGLVTESTTKVSYSDVPVGSPTLNFSFRCREDDAGDYVTTEYVEVLTDNTAPSVSFDPTSLTEPINAFNVTVSVTDSLVGLNESTVSYCLIDGAASCIPDTSGSSLFNVTIDSEGEYTICTYAEDNLGNSITTCSEQGAYVLISNTAPQPASFNNPSEGEYVSRLLNSTYLVSWDEAVDLENDTLTYTLSLYNSTGQLSSVLTDNTTSLEYAWVIPTGLAQEDYYFLLEVCDEQPLCANNTVNFSLDNTKPVLSNAILPSVSQDDTGTFSITLTEENPSTMTVSFKNPDGVLLGPYSMSTSGSGVYTYAYRFTIVGDYTNAVFTATDLAGNQHVLDAGGFEITNAPTTGVSTSGGGGAVTGNGTIIEEVVVSEDASGLATAQAEPSELRVSVFDSDGRIYIENLALTDETFTIITINDRLRDHITFYGQRIGLVEVPGRASGERNAVWITYDVDYEGISEGRYPVQFQVSNSKGQIVAVARVDIIKQTTLVDVGAELLNRQVVPPITGRVISTPGLSYLGAIVILSSILVAVALIRGVPKVAARRRKEDEDDGWRREFS